MICLGRLVGEGFFTECRLFFNGGGGGGSDGDGDEDDDANVNGDRKD